MHRTYLQWAACLGALAVLFGAFGAHGLKEYVPAETISTFETGVRYQFYHVFALGMVGILYERFSRKWLRYAGNSFLLGIFLFSGSLYLLTVFKATNTVAMNVFGIITPFGGVFFIIGWICVFLAVRSKQ